MVSDEALMLEFQRGSRDAFEELFARHRQPLYGFFRRRLESRERAEDLVAANRLYRLTAERSGEAGVASVLDELERTLIEIAHSPSKLSSPQFEDLRRRIESQGILFKVRVIDSQVRQREKQAIEDVARKSS